MIPHSKFHALRLSQFRKDTEIAELEDWEYEERIWVGEAIKFSEWLRTVEDPEALGSLAILIREIDHNLQLLKRHSPYHESDHVLNIAFNILAGDKRIEHLELRRNDEVYLDALGAQRLHDPTSISPWFLTRYLGCYPSCALRV